MTRLATILIVDDEAGMRLTMQRILEGEGHRVLVAADGLAALEIAAASPFDIGLIDYRMVGVDGGRVCADLRRLQPEAALYLVTAHVSPEAADAALASGASGILYKPVDIVGVLRLVDEQAARGPVAAVAYGGQ
jgi:CheY-like chemotaxis protein